jgi:hypothetical protein
MTGYVITAPTKLTTPDLCRPSVFLAGTIDNGDSENWQRTAADYLINMNWVVFNPRRPDWDPTWEQIIENPKFAEQVAWELEGLRRANRIIFHFEPGSLSPVALLEFGMMAERWSSDHFLRVSCPPGFWRRGNVEYICKKYYGRIPFFESLDDALKSFDWVEVDSL